MTLPKFNLGTILVIVAAVLVTLKFRAQIAAIVIKIPVIGPIVAA